MRILVHGGAGGVPDEPEKRQATLDTAATKGAKAATPLDAVEQALRVLEADPQFNAGTGAQLQTDGIPRTDAGMMTSDRSVGAACSMPGVEAAVSVARHVLEETPHVLVAGVHAVDLAASAGIDTGQDLRTERTTNRFGEVSMPEGIDSQRAWTTEHFGSNTEPTDHDTVGAVAVADGQLAAATSTGGRWLALRGRVGDVPQVGAGFYASPTGAASTTGAGEDIARVTLARRAVGHVESGVDAATAATRAIEEFEEITGSRAGVIVADETGGLGSAFCSDAMQTAIVEHPTT